MNTLNIFLEVLTLLALLSALATITSTNPIIFNSPIIFTSLLNYQLLEFNFNLVLVLFISIYYFYYFYDLAVVNSIKINNVLVESQIPTQARSGVLKSSDELPNETNKTDINAKIFDHLNINPWFITGFTDGEGCFYIKVRPSINTKIGWTVELYFNLVAKNNPVNLAMFEEIKQFFGVGRVRVTALNYIYFEVGSFKDCLKIRDHFLNYPLISYKLVYFQLWCKVIDIMMAKEHLTMNGILKIVALKAHSPKRLNEVLLQLFKLCTPISCPNYQPNFKNLNVH